MTKSLEEYRVERYMSVDEFTKLIDVSPQTYYRLLHRKPAYLTTKRKIADRLGVQPADIEEFATRHVPIHAGEQTRPV